MGVDGRPNRDEDTLFCVVVTGSGVRSSVTVQRTGTCSLRRGSRLPPAVGSG